MLQKFAFITLTLGFALGGQAAQSDLSERLEVGKQAFLDGRFRESLQILEEIAPNLEETFLRADCFAFIGMNHLALGDASTADSDFESAIRANPDLVPQQGLFPEASIAAFVAKRKTMVGRIEVRTAPAGADASIGGRAVGTTPYVGNALVGEHLVRVSREDYHRYENTVRVEADETALVEVTMRMTPQALERAREEAARAAGGGPRGTKKTAYIMLGAAAAGGIAAGVLASGSTREAGVPVTRTFNNTVPSFNSGGPFIADVGTDGTLSIDLSWDDPDAALFVEVRLVTAATQVIRQQDPTGPTETRLTVPVLGKNIYHVFFRNLSPNPTMFTLTISFPG